MAEQRSTHRPFWPHRLWRTVVTSVFALGLVAAVGLLLLYLAGVFHEKVPQAGVSPELEDTSRWKTAEVRRVRRPRQEMAVGTIRAVHEVTLAAKLLATVREVRVKAGQKVTHGELLLQLDDSDLQARLSQAEAALQAAEAALAQAVTDRDRALSLRAGNAIPQADVDKSETNVRTATANLERARQAVTETKVQFGYASVTSPIEGLVVDKRVAQGDTVSPGQVLLTLYDPAQMQMVATVRESLAQRLKVGQQVSARLESLGHDCLATISEIVPEAQVASRSFAVKVTGPCPPGVYSGMFGRLYVPLDDEELVVAPSAAFFRIGQLDMARVLYDGKLRRRQVQLGRRLNGDVEILSGLKPGERVVLQSAPIGSGGAP